MQPTRANRNAQTAAACYAERLDECRALLKQIEARLDHHNQEQAATPQNWGHAGDLGQVVQELSQVLALLGDRSAVEKYRLEY
jgi:hypothetical protein